MNSSPAVTGSVRTWLRLEALAILAAAVLLYARGDHSWLLFAILLLAPDLSFIAYAAGPRIGAIVYNIAHSYAVPIIAAIMFLITGRSLAIPLIWIAHIGMDRAVGYGLKYPAAFSQTHLGVIGRQR